MELNTSYYFPMDIKNLLAVLKLIDGERFDIRAGIILQITEK